MAADYRVAVGLSFSDVEPEERYEPGDSIPAKRVEDWMLEEGVVVLAEASTGKGKPRSKAGAAAAKSTEA